MSDAEAAGAEGAHHADRWRGTGSRSALTAPSKPRNARTRWSIRSSSPIKTPTAMASEAHSWAAADLGRWHRGGMGGGGTWRRLPGGQGGGQPLSAAVPSRRQESSAAHCAGNRRTLLRSVQKRSDRQDLRSIAEELRNQYSIGYTPDRASTSGGDYHRIHLTTTQKDDSVQTRDGYYSD